MIQFKYWPTFLHIHVQELPKEDILKSGIIPVAKALKILCNQ